MTDIYAVGGDSGGDLAEANAPVRAPFGRAVDVPAGTGSYGTIPTHPIDLVSAEFDRPKACVLLVQARKTTAGEPVAPDALRLVVTSLLSGGASLVRTLPIQESIPRALRLYGRSVQVAVVNACSQSWRVSGALVEGDNAAPELVATWIASGPAAAAGIVATLAGVLLKAQGFLIAAGASPSYWLQFFDAATVPANGATPLLELGPLVAAGPAPFSVSDDASPSIFFQQGLCWALSHTPGVLTLGDGTARVDVGWGA